MCRKGTEEIIGATIVAEHAGEMLAEILGRCGRGRHVDLVDEKPWRFFSNLLKEHDETMGLYGRIYHDVKILTFNWGIPYLSFLIVELRNVGMKSWIASRRSAQPDDSRRRGSPWPSNIDSGSPRSPLGRSEWGVQTERNWCQFKLPEIYNHRKWKMDEHGVTWMTNDPLQKQVTQVVLNFHVCDSQCFIIFQSSYQYMIALGWMSQTLRDWNLSGIGPIIPLPFLMRSYLSQGNVFI